MGQCGGVIDAVQETVVLALEFGDKAVLKSPELLAKVLQSPQVKKAVEDALLAEGKRLLKRQQEGQAVTNEDGTKVLENVGKAASKAAESAAKKELTSMPEYRKVKDGLKQMECAFRGSPVGVFVDENKGWLVVVAAGLAVGGATGMYLAKTGDWPAGQMSKLAGKLVRFKVLGNVEMGVEDLKFKPSNREVETRVFASAKWTAVTAKVSFSVGFRDDKFASTDGKAEVQVTLAKGLSLTGKGALGYKAPGVPSPDGSLPKGPAVTYDLSLGLSYKTDIGGGTLDIRTLGVVSQDSEQRKVGGTVGAGYKFIQKDAGSASLDFNAGVNRVEQFGPGAPGSPQVGGQVNLGLTIKFK